MSLSNSEQTKIKSVLNEILEHASATHHLEEDEISFSHMAEDLYHLLDPEEVLLYVENDFCDKDEWEELVSKMNWDAVTPIDSLMVSLKDLSSVKL